MTAPFVDIVPLGGLGEIGKNCLVLDCPEGALIVDCGSCFPEQDLGIDVIHPDFSWLEAIRARLLGVFLTHGHEDHIGGIPYLLRAFELPIWGPPHALALVRRRLAEHDLDLEELDLREVAPGNEYEIGPFVVEPIRVAHSIVEATALRIATPAGNLLHTGDFNFDPEPRDGEPTDVERLAAVGEAGVELLLSDSTNVDRQDEASSESDVAEALEELVRDAPQRVVVALFASNIQRLISLGTIARKHKRAICALGRSLQSSIEIGQRLGYLNWPSDLLIAPEQAQSYPASELMVLAGGTQGEANSSLTRLAEQRHSSLMLDAGDMVIMSSRVIPGNERVVSRVGDNLLREGVVLVTRLTHPGVHTSGHAHQPEQRRMLELVRPRAFVPVHGTLHHMRRHAELGRSLGIEPVMTTENGFPLRLTEGQLRARPRVPAGAVAIAYGSGAELDPASLEQRRELARSGVAFVSVYLDARHQPIAPPRLTCVGLPGLELGQAALGRVERSLGTWVERHARDWSRPGVDARDSLRRAARRAIDREVGLRPWVEAHVINR